MEDRSIITVLDPDGEARLYEVINYFTLHETGCKYVLYTDNIEDEYGNIKLFKSKVIETVGKPLEFVELSDREDELVNEVIREIMTNDLID